MTPQPRVSRTARIAIALAVPPVTLAGGALLYPGLNGIVRTLLIVVAIGAYSMARRTLDAYVFEPLNTLANLLEALRRGDRGLRAPVRQGDPFAEVHSELNALAESAHHQALTSTESVALLEGVLEAMDAAIVAFDAQGRACLINAAAERALGRARDRALGLTLHELGLSAWLEHSPATLRLQRFAFRRGGAPHELWVISDLRGTLRAQERDAWRKIVSVLGHEVRNTLTPIKAIAGAHKKVLERSHPPLLDPALLTDLHEGLSVIERRAEGLAAFFDAYAEVARLPSPRWAPLSVRAWIEHVVSLEQRVPVSATGPGEPTLIGDRDQLEQMLLNLVRNAADAALLGGGHVQVRWEMLPTCLIVTVADDGPGIANQNNLFVPHFTTKPGGSGIGLVLARDIAEGHGGSLSLENQASGGCSARIELPIGDAAVHRQIPLLSANGIDPRWRHARG